LENEEKYKSIKAEILSEDSADESGSGSDDDDDSEEEEGKSLFFICLGSYSSTHVCRLPVAEIKEGIEDRMETNLVNLRRVIYLTIMNALKYEEAVHKLLKILLQERQEVRTLFALLHRQSLIVLT
jgi:pre-mRNA-splicing factor CWC22